MCPAIAGSHSSGITPAALIWLLSVSIFEVVRQNRGLDATTTDIARITEDIHCFLTEFRPIFFVRELKYVVP